MDKKLVCEKFAAEHGILPDRIVGSESKAIYWLEQINELVHKSTLKCSDRLIQDPSWGLVYSMLDRIHMHVASSFIQYSIGFPAAGEIVGRSAIESSVNTLYVLKAGNRIERILEYFASYIEQERKQNIQWGKVIISKI